MRQGLRTGCVRARIVQRRRERPVIVTAGQRTHVLRHVLQLELESELKLMPAPDLRRIVLQCSDVGDQFEKAVAAECIAAQVRARDIGPVRRIERIGQAHQSPRVIRLEIARAATLPVARPGEQQLVRQRVGEGVHPGCGHAEVWPPACVHVRDVVELFQVRILILLVVAAVSETAVYQVVAGEAMVDANRLDLLPQQSRDLSHPVLSHQRIHARQVRKLRDAEQ